MPTSPRSVRTTEKSEALFTFEKCTDHDINGSGHENGGSKVIVEGNKVYYHGSSHYKSDNKISNGNEETRYRHDKLTMEKENASELSSKQRLAHLTDETFYDDQTYSSYSKYSRRDGSWKSRHSSKMNNSSNKTTKPYPSEYNTGFNSSSSNNSNKKHFDETMFPFDRAALAYDASDKTVEWTKKHLSSHSNNYYDSPSPDYDYYEQFRSSTPRKSTASTASSDSRQLKELTSLSRKQSMKMSKYDLPPSPPSKKIDQNHQFKNHISESDAFSLPFAKTHTKTSSSSPDNTTITTTSTQDNATSVSVANHTSICSSTDQNPVSQFEQIASKFDKIPSKVPPPGCKYLASIPTVSISNSISILSINSKLYCTLEHYCFSLMPPYYQQHNA